METRCKICAIHSEIKCLERTIQNAEGKFLYKWCMEGKKVTLFS